MILFFLLFSHQLTCHRASLISSLLMSIRLIRVARANLKSPKTHALRPNPKLHIRSHSLWAAAFLTRFSSTDCYLCSLAMGLVLADRFNFIWAPDRVLFLKHCLFLNMLMILRRCVVDMRQFYCAHGSSSLSDTSVSLTWRVVFRRFHASFAVARRSHTWLARRLRGVYAASSRRFRRSTQHERKTPSAAFPSKQRPQNRSGDVYLVASVKRAYVGVTYM